MRTKEQIAKEFEELTFQPMTGLHRDIEELERVLDYIKHLNGVRQ